MLVVVLVLVFIVVGGVLTYRSAMALWTVRALGLALAVFVVSPGRRRRQYYSEEALPTVPTGPSCYLWILTGGRYRRLLRT